MATQEFNPLRNFCEEKDRVINWLSSPTPSIITKNSILHKSRRQMITEFDHLPQDFFPEDLGPLKYIALELLTTIEKANTRSLTGLLEVVVVFTHGRQDPYLNYVKESQVVYAKEIPLLQHLLKHEMDDDIILFQVKNLSPRSLELGPKEVSELS